MTTVKLNISYRSQWDPDAKDHFSDCGPTSLAMILNARGDPITPDEVYKFIGDRGAGQYTSFTDLETERLPFGELVVTVVTARTLYRMKRDTVRLRDRADAEALKRRFRLEDP